MDHYFQTLKDRQRSIRHGFSEALGLRVHRAISWYGRAEQENEEDHDAQFIFLWIAFNAAYAHEFPRKGTSSEQLVFKQFLQKLIDLDQEKRLYELLWRKYPSSIRLILDNKFVFQPFWDHHAGLDNTNDWEYRFNQSKSVALAAIAAGETHKVLRLVLERLYVLRNQIVHGGATWNSQTNRAQARDGAQFMTDLLPIVINLMMDNPDQPWGEPSYPVIAL